MRLVDGTRAKLVNESNILGRCHLKGHPGIITKRILKKHNCIEKQCPFLEKNLENGYWAHLDAEAAKRANAKLQKKRRLDAEHSHLSHEQSLKRQFQKWADELGLDIQIVRVSSIPRGNKVFYVSERPYNDWSDYEELASKARDTLYKGVYLQRVRNPDGSFATREQYNSKKL